MALKLKLSKAQFEKLAEDVQDLYKEVGGEYVLDVDGLEDTGALKRAKDREAQRRKELEAEKKELEDRLSEIEGDDARKKGDIDTLEKSWNGKLEAQKTEYEQKLGSRDAFIKQSLVDAKAMELASKISTSPALILPHIKARLSVDTEGDEFKTRVLDSNGQPSASTLEDLANEFVANKDFASIIKAGQANGSGANNGNQHPNRDGATNTDKDKDLSTLSPSEMAAYLTASKGNSDNVEE